MMNYVLMIFLIFIVLAVLGIFLSMLVDHYLSIGIIHFVYLVATKELFHFIDKKRLVRGDLVFIKFKGKYRKAYIKDVSIYTNMVELEFDDVSLNTPLTKHNHYPLSRIIIPDYMGKMAKILYSEMENKQK